MVSVDVVFKSKLNFLQFASDLLDSCKTKPAQIESQQQVHKNDRFCTTCCTIVAQ